MADPSALTTPIRDIVASIISTAVQEEKVNKADDISAVSSRDDLMLDVSQQLRTLIATMADQQTLLISLGSKVQALEAAQPQLSPGNSNNNNNNITPFSDQL